MTPEIHTGLRTQLATALTALDYGLDDCTLVQARSDLRVVLRVGDVALKVFAAEHSDYWAREVAAYDALDRTGLAPDVAAVGDLWIATAWVELVSLESAESDALRVHRALGEGLARLHAVDPRQLPTISMANRLEGWLRHLPPACPDSLARDTRRVIIPMCGLYRETHFVHGDWDVPNALVSADHPDRVEKIIDFEGAHLGDPTEDFRWQVVGGPPWENYEAMASAYRAAGGDLGDNASERLALAGTDWCLDLLTWGRDHGNSRFEEAALTTLEALVCGRWPEAR